jgi:hypothetical protein
MPHQRIIYTLVILNLDGILGFEIPKNKSELIFPTSRVANLGKK